MAKMQGRGASSNTTVVSDTGGDTTKNTVTNANGASTKTDQFGSVSSGYAQSQYNPSAWYSGLTTYGTVGNFQGFSTTGYNPNEDQNYTTDDNFNTSTTSGLALLNQDGSVGVDPTGQVFLRVATDSGGVSWVPYSSGTNYSNALAVNTKQSGVHQVLSGNLGQLESQNSGGMWVNGPNELGTGVNIDLINGEKSNGSLDSLSSQQAEVSTAAQSAAAIMSAAAKNGVGQSTPTTKTSPTGQASGPSTLTLGNDPSQVSGSEGGATTTQSANGTAPGSNDIQNVTSAATNAFGSNPTTTGATTGATPSTLSTPGAGTTGTTTGTTGTGTTNTTATPISATPTTPLAAATSATTANSAAAGTVTAAGNSPIAPINGSNPVPQVTNPVNHDFIQALQGQIATGNNAALQNSQSQAIQNANSLRLAAGANTLSGNYASEGAAAQGAEALEGQQASQQANLAQQQQQTADEGMLGTALQNESSTELSTDTASMNQQVANIQDIIGTLQNEITGKTDQQSQQIQQYINDLSNQITSYQTASAQSNFNSSTGLTLLQGITSGAASLAPLIAAMVAIAA